MRRWTLFVILVAFLCNSGTIYAQQQKTSPFSDIKGHWAEKTIVEMVNKGILDGYPNGTFQPDQPVKVDQFIKMLILSYTDLHQNGERSWNSAFLQSLSVDNQTILKQDYRYYTFKPSTVGYWAKPFIDVASDLHFLNKSRYSDFSGDMTRENVAEVIYYTLQETEFLEDSQFSQQLAKAYGDLMSATDREQKFIAETLAKGIMQGYPNGFFGVGDKVTRAQALVLLNRLTDKTKRIPVKISSSDKLQLSVPTQGGGTKVIVFPDQRMRDAYDVLKQAGQLRGSNHELADTTLRLFKDQKEKDNVLALSTGSVKPQEEVALWLDPQYNTYGITIRLRDGALARNQEAVDTFANFLFGYNAATFNKWFTEVCVNVGAGTKVASKQVQIGDDAVEIIVDSASKTVIFSVAKKKA
ncbi:S-layer homology domain-containing protein [Cohnella endophytica]|uniref:S-layer homology domain-containing protein n=1 Tax=Cohnella endophytica TaxID=2419778 RepID=A0A494XPS8_9BACL|nr:S-layer homology domain-containing protein [Cohnella endophytica]RKP50074.1 S-layer homology domain-containing protein [Cohnella endophytica]